MTTNLEIDELELAAIRCRRAEYQAICAVEGIVPTAEQEAMFDMFDRERWPHERRLAYVIERARKRAGTRHA